MTPEELIRFRQQQQNPDVRGLNQAPGTGNPIQNAYTPVGGEGFGALNPGMATPPGGVGFSEINPKILPPPGGIKPMPGNTGFNPGGGVPMPTPDQMYGTGGIKPCL